MDSSLFLTTAATAIGLFTLFQILRFYQDNEEEEESYSYSPSSSSLSPSTAPPLSASRTWTHHVFPSFRGEDVRRDFLSHIQMEFQRKGIPSFIDNQIKRGKSIGPELVRAIRGSKIAVILISKNYASSKWCLDELVEIMKSREELGQTVLAIFYKVDPSDVKKLTGDFGQVFRKTCAGKTKRDIGRWRKALAEVATIAGYHSVNWDNEAYMIKKIATDISDLLNYSTSSRDYEGLIGIGAHLEKLEPLLCLDSNDVRMIGICGPSGIGKTTIARAAYNQLSNSFSLSVFMDNIKENYTRLRSDDYSAKLQLQRKFLSRLTNDKDMEIPHLGVVQDRLKDKKVLVVLDDVDHLGQLDAMAKETRWFGPGSRIIITTQDQRLFRAHGIDNIYKVDFPPDEEALQILCVSAFGQKSPKHGFEELAQEVTNLAGNLPLGLKVLGSYFRGMSKQEWISSLPILKASLNADIQSILKFSYDALDDVDKDLFLHIACFFNRAFTCRAEWLLGKKFLEVRQRLNVLAEKSLISIHSNWIEMHSLLQQLGVDIVRKQSIHEPGQRRFLLDIGEIRELLTDDAAGSKSVIGIDFIYNGEEFDISEKAFEGMPNLQFLRLEGELSYNTLHLPRGLNYISRKLRLLDWRHFPMTCLPSNVNVEFLVELDMHHSKLEKLWDGVKSLRNLSVMELSYSVNLKELPDLSTATNLKLMDLRGCSSLVKLPSTNGYTTSLEELFLLDCSSLTKLPSSVGNATNLKHLYLGGCSSLLELPSTIGNATNLGSLNLSYCSSLVELPLSFGNLQKLKSLDLSGCSKIEFLPTNINLKSLDELDLTDCSSLKRFPEISTNIRYLTLTGTAIEEVPYSIRSWLRLSSFHISYFEDLRKFPHALGSITNLYLSNTEIQEVSLPRILFSLSRLVAMNCQSLERLNCSFMNPRIHLNFGNCFKLNQEARDLIIQTSEEAVLPGRRVPTYFSHRNPTFIGNSLTVKLKERPLPKSVRFKACILLVNVHGDAEYTPNFMLTLKYRKSRHVINPVLTEHLYIFQVEAEVTSSELVFEFEIEHGYNWMVKACGLQPLGDIHVPRR